MTAEREITLAEVERLEDDLDQIRLAEPSEEAEVRGVAFLGDRDLQLYRRLLSAARRYVEQREGGQ